jgi:hypothetical protein
MPDEVKEELILRDAEYLVGDLDEEAEPLAGDQVELLHEAAAEVAGPRGGLDQAGLGTAVVTAGWPPFKGPLM